MEEEDAQLLENLNDKIVHFKMFNFSDHDSSLTSTWTKLRKIALATTLLVCFVPFVYSNYVADGHYHGLEKRTTLHKHATEILFAMCCLMFVDSVLDFLFTPINLLGTVDAVANLKVALLCSLFFPTLILLVLENQIYANFTVGLFIGVLAAQSFALCSTLFLFLNFHDEQIWTWQRTNFLVTLQIVTTFFRIAEYLYDMSWMYIVILALVIFQVLLIAFFGTQWILKHFVVLFEVFGWSKISVAARISSDEYMIICYICANFVLALSVIFVINTPAVLYVQTAVATVMILCPGRVARRNAVQLDVSIDSSLLCAILIVCFLLWISVTFCISISILVLCSVPSLPFSSPWRARRCLYSTFHMRHGLLYKWPTWVWSSTCASYRRQLLQMHPRACRFSPRMRHTNGFSCDTNTSMKLWMLARLRRAH